MGKGQSKRKAAVARTHAAANRPVVEALDSRTMLSVSVGTTPLRVNAGGPAYTDSAGRAWKADDGFVGGTASTAPFAVAGTTDDSLYSSRRWGAFNYVVPVAANGTYQVKLHFADPLYTTAGKRKFTVKAEGNTILSNFDVAANGGGKAALVKTFSVNVTDGTLNLAFLKNVENPILSALEVIPPGTTPPPATVGSIASLSLINANSDAVIGTFANGAVLDTTGGKAYSVRANVSGTVKSVKFLLDGAQIRLESTAPYAVAGDSGTDFLPWNVPVGGHTLTVIPYSGTGGSGTAGTAVTVNFTVTKDATPPPTSGFTKLTYVNKAANPINRSEALTATYAGRLYTFGGFNLANGPVMTSHYYTPSTNTWTKVRDLPQRLTHVGVAQTETDVYFVGGYYGLPGKTGYGQIYGSAKVWKYNFAADTYTEIKSLPRALAAGGAAIVDGKLHYFGGQPSDRSDINVHLVLDLSNQAAGWQSAAAIPHGRSHMGSVALGGKIYAIAGQTGNDGTLTTFNYVERYDPATNAWQTLAAIPRAISHIASATFVMDGRIIVMGGETAHEAQSREVYAYTPGTNGWQTLTSLPAARFSGVAGVIGGKIYFSTGGNSTTTWEATPG